MDTTEKRCHDAVNHSTEIVKKRRVRRKLFKDGLADEHKENEPVFHKFGGLRTECVCFFVFCKYQDYYTVNTAQVTSNYHLFLILLIIAHASK